MEVIIENATEVIAKLSPELLSKPVNDFWTRVCNTIENAAKENAPVDTGLLRSKMAHEIEDAVVPTWAQVGNSVFYAPYIEYGTGMMADGEGGKGGRHWPPGEALDLWASRHGFGSGAQVARIIGQRGGLEPRRFLRNAIESSRGAFEQFVERLADDVGREWEAGT